MGECPGEIRTGDLNISLSEYDAVGATSFPAFVRRVLMPSTVRGSAVCSPISASFAESPTPPTFVGWRLDLVVENKHPRLLTLTCLPAAYVHLVPSDRDWNGLERRMLAILSRSMQVVFRCQLKRTCYLRVPPRARIDACFLVGVS